MQLTIHRGTEEFGGSCIELQTKEARILIDFGFPLRGDHPLDDVETKSMEHLKKDKLIPDIKGLYENPSFDGILISHPHPDHYGLLPLVDKSIPLYMSEGTKTMIETTYFFRYPKRRLHKVKIISAWEKFKIKIN